MGASFLQRCADRLATLGTNVRVRVLVAPDGEMECIAGGGSSRLSAARARALVLGLGPTRAGTVDLFAHPRGGWSIRVRGELRQEGLEQRLRNMLVNLKPGSDVTRLGS
jgi:hypothetical protein